MTPRHGSRMRSATSCVTDERRPIDRLHGGESCAWCILMSFAPEMSLSNDDKRWLAFAFAGALIGAVCTAACDLAKTETAAWLQRRREAKKAQDSTKE
jgi:hypothetical protein